MGELARLGRKIAGAALVLAMALGGMSCNGGTNVLAPAEPPPVSIDVLRAAPDTLSLAGYPTVVGPYLWRDFAPGSPQDGGPLNATVTYYPISDPEFSKAVTSVYMWVLNGNEVWMSGMKQEDPSHYPHNEIVWSARNGPKWGPGIQVDVITGLMIEGRGLQLVKSSQVTIVRTD